VEGQLLALLETVSEKLDSPSLSHKMEILEQILDHSAAANDKVLVFTHSLDTLDYIERRCKKSRRRYARLDGATRMKDRQTLTRGLNKTNTYDVCLISTRAGSQGLNFYGANRVVIMDDYFNPMYEEQAIGRAYRIGQTKHVYVYRLSVGGTFEDALHNQSLFKIQLANRVVDKKKPQRHALKGFGEYVFPPKHVEQKVLDGFRDKDPGVLTHILESQKKSVFPALVEPRQLLTVIQTRHHPVD
jgi:SNF2 family DNA or RNA helicase